MTKMVKCPACKGRGQIGFSTQTDDGNACFDFECDFCRGRGRVSKKRAEKYEKEKTKKENKKAEETD